MVIVLCTARLHGHLELLEANGRLLLELPLNCLEFFLSIVYGVTYLKRMENMGVFCFDLGFLCVSFVIFFPFFSVLC